MSTKKSLAVEQVFVIGLFLIALLVLVWITFYTAKRAKVIDETDIKDKIEEEKNTLIFDMCENYLDKQIDAGEFHKLFSYVSEGGCARGADRPYEYAASFPLNDQILKEVAVSGGFTDGRNNPDINYLDDCSPLKNSRIFSVQQSALETSDFLLYVNPAGGISICSLPFYGQTQGACESGECAPLSCTDACTPGEISCQDQYNQQTCADYNGDGCLEWGAFVQCSADSFCEPGVGCTQSCTDECTIQEIVCIGDTAQTDCGYYDSDLCLDLGNIIACPFGAICMTGQGCTTPQQQNSPPQISSVTPSIQAAGQQITFTAAASDSQNNPIQLRWSFDDGLTWTSFRSPQAFKESYTYQAHGEKTIKVEPRDSTGAVGSQFTYTFTIAAAEGAGSSCNTDGECSDGYFITTDICNNPGTANSYCIHSPTRPISPCHGFSLSDKSDWESSNLVQNCDIIDGRVDFPNSAMDAYKNQLKQNGKIFSVPISVEEYYQTPNSQIEANKEQYIQTIYNKFKKVFDNGYDALTFDELSGFEQGESSEQLMSAVSIAIERLKKAYPTKIILVAGSWAVPQTMTGRETLNKILTYADFYLPEVYIADDYSLDLATRLKDIDRNFNNFDSTAGRKLIYLLAASDVEDWSTDQDPSIDFYKFIDNQFSIIKQDTTQGLNTGIGIFTFGKSNLQTKSWISKLLRHYLVLNQNTPYSLQDYQLNHLTNPSFEQSTAGWTISQGQGVSVGTIAKGSVSPAIETLSLLQKVPNKNYVLSIKKGTTQTTIFQTISNLQTGKTYYLESYSKKHSGDFAKSNIQTKLTDMGGNQLPYVYTKNTLYTILRVPSYGLTLSECRAINPNCSNQKHLWTKEELVFTATSSQIKIVIDDQAAPQGETSLMDFIQVQEYTLAPPSSQQTPQSQTPVCGNGIKEGTEQCDDVNLNNNDACKNDCTNNVCGDGVIRTGVEQCDNSQQNSACPATCSLLCTINNCGPVCGNQICESTETCSACPQDCGICPPPTPCTLTIASITPTCGSDGVCSQGETITLTSTVSGSCPTTTLNFQIDANDNPITPACDIQYSGGHMSGLNINSQIVGSTIQGPWTIPNIPSNCQGKTIVIRAAAIRQGGPPGTGTVISSTTSVSGLFTFISPPSSQVCGNGVREGTEACDNGVSNSNQCPAICSTSCTANTCTSPPSDQSRCTAPAGGWCDNFDTFDTSRWSKSNFKVNVGTTPTHDGYVQPDRVSVESGYLKIRLTQTPGTTVAGQQGVISRGGEIGSGQRYGYGIYEFRMRMASTSSTPTGACSTDPYVCNPSGSVSAAFNYATGSETELDFEVEAQFPERLELTTWNYYVNPDRRQHTSIYNFKGMSQGFKLYKMVWCQNGVKYYAENPNDPGPVLRNPLAIHRDYPPSTAAPYLFSLWGTNSGGFGGPATPNVDRYEYVDWVKFTPLPSCSIDTTA